MYYARINCYYHQQHSARKILLCEELEEAGWKFQSGGYLLFDFFPARCAR